ncbi:MAG: hypothetical protein V1790_08250, partial [Planctomycetota bacterium]
MVKSVRTARGPRHQVVSYLGELEPGEKAGWAHVGRITRRPQSAQLRLFDDTGPSAPVPEKVEVLVRRARVERTRDFGDVYLGLLLWQTLELDKLLDHKINRGRSRIPWPLMATVSTLGRFCEPSSELHIADTWYLRTALDDLLGIPDHLVNTQRLYRTHDALLPHKEAIETHLKERFTHSPFAPHDGERRADGPGVSASRAAFPHAASSPRGTIGPPTFLGNPLCLCPALRPRWDGTRQASTTRPRGPRMHHDEGSSPERLSGLHHTAWALAVYASPHGSPHHDARLASG